MSRLERQQRRASRLFTHAAHLTALADPASKHYYDKLSSQEFHRLMTCATTLSAQLGPRPLWAELSSLSLRSHQVMSRLLQTFPLVVVALVVDVFRPLAGLSPIPMLSVWAALCWASYLRTGRCARRVRRRLHGDVHPFDALGRHGRRVFRRHAGAAPAAALADEQLRAVIVERLGPFDRDTVETAVSLAGEFDGTAAELLDTAALLVL